MGMLLALAILATLRRSPTFSLPSLSSKIRLAVSLGSTAVAIRTAACRSVRSPVKVGLLPTGILLVLGSDSIRAISPALTRPKRSSLGLVSMAALRYLNAAAWSSCGTDWLRSTMAIRLSWLNFRTWTGRASNATSRARTITRSPIAQRCRQVPRPLMLARPSQTTGTASSSPQSHRASSNRIGRSAIKANNSQQSNFHT